MKIGIWLAEVLVVTLLLAAVWAMYLDPSIQPATEAQIRTVVPADLLPSAPANPAARSRFALLAQTCEGMKLASADLAGYVPSSLPHLRAYGPLAATAMGVVRKGPLQASPDELSSWKSIKLLAKELALQAQMAGKAGDSAACERYIADGLDLAAATRSAGGATAGYLEYEAMDAIATDTAADCIRSGWLKPAELRRLIGAVKQYGFDDEDLKVDYRQDLQQTLFDPAVGLVAASNDPRGHQGQSGDHRQVGNFDALATATMLGKVYGEWIENAGRPWAAQVTAEADRVDDLARNLPEEPQTSVPGASLTPGASPEPPGDVAMLEYRMQMNEIPNSCGIALLSDVSGLGISSRQASITTSCIHELVRALAAVWLYKGEHGGKYPDTLEEVVAAGYLKQLPKDWFSQSPLLFNPRTHVIYSVGDIMADRCGEFTKDVTSGHGNIGFVALPRSSQE